ncbi:MAG: AAA family ATPase [Chlamydiia bacterium]|nr:AAA family ATPase [Chlamydiia bacterium]
MRISISGTHFSGKSTLVRALVKALPDYIGIDEPYFILEQEGYLFSHPPLVQDYEQQCKRSVQLILESDKRTIFDRCPLDFLAYALAVGKDRVDLDFWKEEIEKGIHFLDFILFLPIEEKDQIPIPPSENKKLRQKVDENLYELLMEDSLAVLGKTKVIEITGTLEKRVARVIDLKL